MKQSLIGLVVVAVALGLVCSVTAGPSKGKGGGHSPGSKNHAKPHPGNHHHHGNQHHHKHHHHKHHNHKHHHKTYTGGQDTEGPLQEVRYLRVSNNSGDDLRVYAKLEGGEVKVWNIAGGETSYLEIDDVRLAASEVYLWATAPGKRWSNYENEPLTLVSAPYRADNIGTFTFTFNP